MNVGVSDIIKRKTIAKILDSIVAMDLQLANLAEASSGEYTSALTKADFERTSIALDVIRAEVFGAFGE